jgi:hypothetical protein
VQDIRQQIGVGATGNGREEIADGGRKPVTVHTLEDVRLWHRWSGRRRIDWCGERSIEVYSGLGVLIVAPSR